MIELPAAKCGEGAVVKDRAVEGPADGTILRWLLRSALHDKRTATECVEARYGGQYSGQSDGELGFVLRSRYHVGCYQMPRNDME